MTRLPRALVLAIVVGLIAVLAGVAFWPSSVSIDTATITRGALRVALEEEGRARSNPRATVQAPVFGRALRVHVEPGQPVKRGTMLATIAPMAAVPDPALQIDLGRLASAEAAVSRNAATANATGAFAFLQGQVTDVLELLPFPLVSADVLERQGRAARSSEDARQAAQEQLARAEAERDTILRRLTASRSLAAPVVVRAPIDGVLLKRYRDSDAIVAAGEPLFDVGDPANIEIVTAVLSRDAVDITPGRASRVQEWGGEPLNGRVARVDPSAFTTVSALGVTEQRINVFVDLDDPKAAAASGLRDGFAVQTQIVVWEAPEVVKAPAGSLFRAGDRWAVYVVDGGRARQREVAVGRRSGFEAQIVSGLQPGDRVILHPPETVTEGVRVVPR